MGDLYSHHAVMQASWNVVKSSYSGCFPFVDGEKSFSRHLSCRCCTQSRRTGTGDTFLRAAAA